MAVAAATTLVVSLASTSASATSAPDSAVWRHESGVLVVSEAWTFHPASPELREAVGTLDSGGPVYTVNGGVWAKGVISGLNGQDCSGSARRSMFTDMVDIKAGYGGSPKSS